MADPPPSGNGEPPSDSSGGGPPPPPRPAPVIASAVAQLGSTEPPRATPLPDTKYVQPLAPVAAAGVDLAKTVLKIVVWAFVGLLVYLFLIDLRDGASQEQVNNQVFRQANSEFDGSLLDSIDDTLRALQSGIDDPQSKSLKSDAEAGEALASTLFRDKILSDEQRASLLRCLPFPDGAERPKLLSACHDMLALARKSAQVLAGNLDKLKLMIDFSKTIESERQTFHAFWAQTAQLVLLNLLLPLLTGLFGYIFGTRQGAAGEEK
jgi:hypothetical protein